MNAECRRVLHSYKDYGYWCHHKPKHAVCIRCDGCGFEDVERSNNASRIDAERVGIHVEPKIVFDGVETGQDHIQIIDAPVRGVL